MCDVINENVKNASKESFWSLLKDYRITIPRMQRNYAQGRRDADVTQKRENLLNDIFDSLSNKSFLDLNFIYGNVKDNNFVPIDGQQRLTTLFLLHWYFMSLSKKRTEENLNVLLKFTYETRDITRQFCQHLINDVDIDPRSIDSIEKTIKDYYWFFSDFDYDSSISSMLVMLQTIHSKVKKMGFDSCVLFFDLLTSENCPLSFLFLNIDDVGLTDEIYIKMNARGKPLTEFENFKAQLTNYLASKDKQLADSILTKINCEWSQFFWAMQYKSGKAAVFDDQIMNFFKFWMFNDYICNNNAPGLTDREKIRFSLKLLKDESTFEFTNRLFKDEFMNVGLFKNSSPVVSENTFRKLFRLLNTLSYSYQQNGNLHFYSTDKYSKKYFDENDFFNKIINVPNFNGLGYEDQVQVYAEYAFISKYSNDDGSFDRFDELTDWIRYIYNLSKAQLYNQQDDYYRSIRSINTMIENDYALNILKYASKMSKSVYRQGKGFGFNELQAKEESIKAHLLLKDSKWLSYIIEAENSYLDNQLSCLLNFSGIEANYDMQMGVFEKTNPNELEVDDSFEFVNDLDVDSFVEYLIKIETFFDKTKLKKEFEENSIFRRALLTFGNEKSYLLVKEGQNYSFLDDGVGSKSRDYSFKRLLRDENGGKRMFLKNLLDGVDDSKDISNILEQLNGLISSFVSHNTNSWKYYFIEMPEILDCLIGTENHDPSGDYVFKQSGRFINMKNKDEILLCEGQSTRSMNREFYSYVLYLKAKKKGLQVNYVKDFTETADKYLSFENKNGSTISINYSKDPYDPTGKFNFLISNNGISIIRNSDIDYVLNYITMEIK